MDVIFISEEKDCNYCYAVIKVDPMVKEAIQSIGNRLYIGMGSCKVVERYHLLQCYKCQKFGHKEGTNYCPLKNTENLTFSHSNHVIL